MTSLARLAAAALAAAGLLGTPAVAVAAPHDPNTRIVGGRPATEDYPFFGHLGGCGSSLIAPTWAVTAAHCVSGARQVRLDSRTAGQGGETLRVKRSVRAPGGADLALLELSGTARTAPITIAAAHPAVGTQTRIIGFGSTTPDGSSPSRVLKELDTSVVEPRRCANIPQVPAADPNTELCTGSPNSQGACHGDSGGPQVTKVDGVWHLVGATSRGAPRRCAVNSSPSIYVSVPAFLNWIRQTTGISTLGR